METRPGKIKLLRDRQEEVYVCDQVTLTLLDTQCKRRFEKVTSVDLWTIIYPLYTELTRRRQKIFMLTINKSSLKLNVHLGQSGELSLYLDRFTELTYRTCYYFSEMNNTNKLKQFRGCKSFHTVWHHLFMTLLIISPITAHLTVKLMSIFNIKHGKKILHLFTIHGTKFLQIKNHRLQFLTLKKVNRSTLIKLP
jgi:hypothetical protein